jgi:alkylation response protein AidB-like acyl-CoA dehydrogenase
VCTSALQVHGGIGFTWEHDLHFFLKRAKVDALLYGSAREHRDAVAMLSAPREAAASAA